MEEPLCIPTMLNIRITCIVLGLLRENLVNDLTIPLFGGGLPSKRQRPYKGRWLRAKRFWVTWVKIL